MSGKPKEIEEINVPKKAYLHCSATPNFNKTHQSFDKYGRAEIEEWHKSRGWSGCGYHVVIRRTGVIEYGRDIAKIPAHAKGYNKNSLAVCLIGSGKYTTMQIDSLIKVYLWSFALFNIDYNEWYGHYEIDPIKKPDCPGTDMGMVRMLLKLYHIDMVGGV